MNMKRSSGLYFFAMILPAVFMLSSCGGKSDSSAPDDAPASQPAASQATSQPASQAAPVLRQWVRIQKVSASESSDHEPSEVLYAHGVGLHELPAYDWRIKSISPTRVELVGVSSYPELGDSKDDVTDHWQGMTAELILAGQWTAPSDKTYDVYYLYYDLQMQVAGPNVRGCHRNFFVRDGKVAHFSSGFGELRIYDGQLFYGKDRGEYVPLPEMEITASGL